VRGRVIRELIRARGCSLQKKTEIVWDSWRLNAKSTVIWSSREKAKQPPRGFFFTSKGGSSANPARKSEQYIKIIDVF